MFDPAPMTDKQKQMIDSYKHVPPFSTDYNATNDDKKTPKKMSDGK